LPAVEIARVLAGAKSFKDQGIANVSDTYRGQILIGASDVRPAIIKDIPVRELANEVLAATLGVALSLPVPPPFLAIADPSDLPTKYAPMLGKSALLFASADLKSPSVAQLVINQTSAAPVAILSFVKNALVACGQLGEFYGFDGWTANTDRHVGNILIETNQRPWLIDHGRAFTGPAWTPHDLDPAKLYRHRLKEWLTPVLDGAEQANLAALAAAMVPKLSALDVNDLGEQNRVAALLGQSDFNQLVTFLKDRIAFVPRIAADALNQPRIV
jgi:hypothetical protein